MRKTGYLLCRRSRAVCHTPAECHLAREQQKPGNCSDGFAFVELPSAFVRKHEIDNGNCWCKPELDYVTEDGVCVYKHKY